MLQDTLFYYIEPSMALTVYILSIFVLLFVCICVCSVCRQCYNSINEVDERETRFDCQAPRAPILTSLPLDYKYGKLLYDTTYAESDVMEPNTLRKLISLYNPCRCVCNIFNRCFQCSCLGRDDSQGILMDPKSVIGPNLLLKMEGEMWKYARIFHLLNKNLEGSYMEMQHFEMLVEKETEV